MYIFENYSGDIENENGSDIIVGESSIDDILKNNTNYLADQRAKLSFNANNSSIDSLPCIHDLIAGLPVL